MQIQVKRYRMLLDDEEEEELTLLDHAERHNASFLDLVEFDLESRDPTQASFARLFLPIVVSAHSRSVFVFIFVYPIKNQLK